VPTPSPGRRLVLKLTAGPEAPERCSQGFTVAATAVAAGVQVSLWLTGESTWFAVTGRGVDLGLAHAAPVSELLEVVREAGLVTVCSQCAARRDLAEADLLPGVRIAGAATFVDEATADGVQALVY
jgi:predicted peroxiredoxin